MERKSFVFNLDWAEVLMSYPPEVRLEVYDAIIRYAQSGTLSQLKPVANMAFSFIKKEMDRNQEKYEGVCKRNQEKAQKRWSKLPGDAKNAAACHSIKLDAKNATACNGISADAENADNDNDNDDEYDNDIKEKSSSDEDDKKKVSPSTSSTVGLYSLDGAIEALKSERAWQEAVCMKNHITPEEVMARLDDFRLHCQVTGEEHYTLGNVKRHFAGWLGKILITSRNENQQSDSLSRRRGTEPGNSERKRFKGSF